MKKKRTNLLLVSDADNFFTKEYIKNVLLPLKKYNIIIASNYNSKNADWYKKKRVRVITTRDTRALYSRIKGLRTLITVLKERQIARRINPAQIVFHGPHWCELMMFNHIRLDSKFTMCYWGSDLFRHKNNNLRMVTKAVRRAEDVVLMTKELKERFEVVYSGRYKYHGREHIIDFGSSHFDNIDNLALSMDEAKKEYGVDSARIVITVGYNGKIAQQHDKVCQGLIRLPKAIKEKIFVIFPMTYGKSNEKYEARLQYIMHDAEIPYRILTEYMDGDGIATLCRATDIFVNAQITDALSESVIEQLYAGAVLISGEWLKYSFLDDNNVYYLKYANFSKLSQLIEEVIFDLDAYRCKSLTNHDILRDTHGWDICRKKWEEVLI